MNNNKGNALIIVLVYFMLAVGAIGMLASDIQIAATSITISKQVRMTRQDQVWIIAYLKKQNALGTLENGAVGWQDSIFKYQSDTSGEEDIVVVEVAITSPNGSQNFAIYLDKTNNWVEKLEIME